MVVNYLSMSRVDFGVPYGRGLDDVVVGRTVNSDGGGVRGTYCGRIVSGCGGLRCAEAASLVIPFRYSLESNAV